MKIELNQNDRICFFGDSITAAGGWIGEITQYFVDHYPALKIGFYNCGVPGSTATEANLKDRMYFDCFQFGPKYTVIMFGMNDIGRQLYSPKCDLPDSEQLRKQRLTDFKENMESIISRCRRYAITPILCTPTPYDEYNEPNGSDTKSDNWFADTGIQACCRLIEDMARENDLLFIDMYAPMRAHICEDPIKFDRTHPNAFGHHLMAEAFLMGIGAKETIEPYEKCVLSPINQKRFDAEQKYRMLMFIEHNLMGWQCSPTQKLARRKRIMQKKGRDKQDPIWEWIKNFDTYADFYSANADFKEEMLAEIVKYTLEVYAPPIETQ